MKKNYTPKPDIAPEVRAVMAEFGRRSAGKPKTGISPAETERRAAQCRLNATQSKLNAEIRRALAVGGHAKGLP